MRTITFPTGYGLGYGQTIPANGASFKPPLVVVGANIYLRERIKRDVLQDWDVTLLFFPTSKAVYTVGVLYVSRKDNGIVSLDVCEGNTVSEALGDALAELTAHPILNDVITLKPQAIMWLASSIYACPKISLNEVLRLEAFKAA